MLGKYIRPSIKLNSFSCPYCEAIAHQDWFRLGAKGIDNGGIPLIPDDSALRTIKDNENIKYEDKKRFIGICEKIMSGVIFLEEKYTHEFVDSLHNVWLSKCYSCKKLSIWVHDRLIFPSVRQGEEPNADLPEELRADFEEARAVLDLSPRAAAALLRLCIEKLCQKVGDPKKGIDQNIAYLVKNGLDVRIQQALDVVRVIGNEAVHPGQVDLRDNRETALKLFALVNMISHHLITQPKQIKELYDGLPPSKLDAIARRDRIIY